MKLHPIQLVAVALVLTLTQAFAQGPGFGRGGRGPGPGFGRGPGFGHGQGGPGKGGPGQGAMGHGRDERHDEDHEVFQFLLSNHEKITRTVKQLENGVETVTESDDDEVADKIKEHVEWMEYRIEKTHPIRMRDPLFAELFKHTDKIKMQHEQTEKGVRVTETSDDPYVAKLIQAHAEVVSGFVARGFAEAMKNHAVPNLPSDGQAKKPTAITYSNPVVKRYGKVVQLPNAAQQPRDGSKICVDVTKGGEPGELNSAIEKVAKFVNIYHGAGKRPAELRLAVVLHGDATLAALNGDVYAKRFGTSENPNFDCLHELHEAGVEIYVCGQSLISQGAQPDDVVVFVDVAVSALTALANLQADGYGYLPLLK